MSDWRHVSRWLAGAVDRWARRCAHQPERITVRVMPGPQPVRGPGPIRPALLVPPLPPEWPAIGELVWVRAAEPLDGLYDGPALVTARTGRGHLWVKPLSHGLFPFEVERDELWPVEPDTVGAGLLALALGTPERDAGHAAP